MAGYGRLWQAKTDLVGFEVPVVVRVRLRVIDLLEHARGHLGLGVGLGSGLGLGRILIPLHRPCRIH